MTRDINVRPDPISRILVSQGSLYPSAEGDGACDLLNPSERLAVKFVNDRPFIQQLEIQWALPKNFGHQNKDQSSNHGLQFEAIHEKLEKIKPRFYKVALKLGSLFGDPESKETLLLHEFLTRRYITAFSYGTRIDCDDSIAITPEDGLVLNITKNTYQTLGLVGKELKIRGKAIGRYLITIDIASLIKSRSKMAERVRWCFSHTYCHSFTFLMAFTDPVLGEDVEAKALLDAIAPGAYKAYSTSIGIKEINADLPNYCNSTFPFTAPLGDPCTEESILDLMEWSGAISCGLLGLDDKAASLFDRGTLYHEGRIVKITWRGFLTPTHIKQIYNLWCNYAVDLYLSHKDSNASNSAASPLFALVIWGFEDSPISWRQSSLAHSPHTFHLSGENISFIFTSPSFPNLPFVLINAASPDDFSMG